MKKVNLKLKIAALEDLFWGDMHDCRKTQWLKPNIQYWLIENNKILNACFFSPDNLKSVELFREFYILVSNQRILIPENFYCQSIYKTTANFKKADRDDLIRFRFYYYYSGNEVSGPFQMEYDFNQLDSNNYQHRKILENQKKGIIYVLVG